MRATFYLTGKQLAPFKPVVRCKEIPLFQLSLLEVRMSGAGRSFEADLEVSRLTKTVGAFTLVLEPQLNEPPVAYAVLQVFAASDITQALAAKA